MVASARSTNLAPTRDGGTDPLGQEVDAAGAGDQVTRSRRRVPPALRAGAPTWTWTGIAIAVVGFVLIAVAWGQVAGETQVYLQLPYVVSGAFAGVGLVMVGLTVLNVATRQRDGADRDSHIAQLAAILEELKEEPGKRDRA